eukprot:CAMPEP_0197858386 /NCGR_PEP_ID=MMETSP1438-20131217/32164_1 /TAXON_ID=1461541 /ORGANISM="Pterosperma sp., Strain CCMP1384" /LENGTH=166 /DNA_ID=CAMNT_0043474529 /DNA_START=69 /DNA_END=572 /DNA_ORIENTATION=+
MAGNRSGLARWAAYEDQELMQVEEQQRNARSGQGSHRGSPNPGGQPAAAAEIRIRQVPWRGEDAAGSASWHEDGGDMVNQSHVLAAGMDRFALDSDDGMESRFGGYESGGSAQRFTSGGTSGGVESNEQSQQGLRIEDLNGGLSGMFAGFFRGLVGPAVSEQQSEQ